jgi:hypothetical protein
MPQVSDAVRTRGRNVVKSGLTAAEAMDALGRVAAGPVGAHRNAAVAEFLGDLLQKNVTLISENESGVQFNLDLSTIYLRGVGEHTRCLLLGGGTGAVDLVRELWKTKTGLPIVFCASAETAAIARQVIPADYGVVVPPENFRTLLGSLNPPAALRQLFWQQIGRRRLSLYDICLPATGNVFFGRERELQQLLENDRVSYAIPGPGRIGKSSILKRHKWNLIRRHDPRKDRVYEIDFYAVDATDSDEVAQHISKAIEVSSRSSKMRVSELLWYLKRWRREKDGPLELLLDETDEVCGGEAFRQLGHAAKEGYVRLIMAGRGGLFDFAIRAESPMDARVRLLRLEPLDHSAARDLLTRPLSDLGIQLRNTPWVLDHILQWTGRLPHLIQFYAQQLVDLSVERKVDELTANHITELEKSGAFSQYFLAPFLEIIEPKTRTLATALLRSPQPKFTTHEVLAAATQAGLSESPDWVRRTCDQLVIQNILAWEGGLYRPASVAMQRYAAEAELT